MMPKKNFQTKIDACSPICGSWPQILSFIKHINLKVNLFMDKLKYYDLNYQKIQMIIIEKSICGNSGIGFFTNLLV